MTTSERTIELTHPDCFYIDGQWTPASSTETFEVLDCSTEQVAARVARGWSIESGILHRIAKPRIGQFLGAAFRQYAQIASTYPFVESRRSASGHRAYGVKEPVGVVLAIVPWNGPAALTAYKVAPALLAGCTVVLKPSPEAPTSAYLFAQICDEVGLPPGVVNVVTAERDVSEQLVRHPDVAKITFTGSTAAGRSDRRGRPGKSVGFLT